MIYIIQVAFQDYDSDHCEPYISYSNVAYCATKEVAEKEIAKLLSIKKSDSNKIELSSYNKVKAVDLYSIVEKKLLQ